MKFVFYKKKTDNVTKKDYSVETNLCIVVDKYIDFR